MDQHFKGMLACAIWPVVHKEARAKWNRCMACKHLPDFKPDSCQQEQHEREREMVEAVVARIEAEDRAAEGRQRASRETIQAAMQQSLEDRRLHQAAAKAAAEAEEHR